MQAFIYKLRYVYMYSYLGVHEFMHNYMCVYSCMRSCTYTYVSMCVCVCMNRLSLLHSPPVLIGGCWIPECGLHWPICKEPSQDAKSH